MREYVFHDQTKRLGDAQRDIERRRMLVILDRVYRLTAHADKPGQLLLCHLTMLESEFSNVV